MMKRRFFLPILALAIALSGATARAEDIYVVPGGQSVGVAVATEGLVVIGNSDLGNVPSPARLAGLRAGDRLIALDGETITSAEHLQYLLDGKDRATITVDRDGQSLEVDVAPIKDGRDGVNRLGVWVRDSAAGVGTLSFYDPQSLRYGALGHAITDVDTGTILSVDRGLLYGAQVVDVRRGETGEPGELIGQFQISGEAAGDIEKNTAFGVFGLLEAAMEGGLYGAVPLAEPENVKTGSAQLLTTLDGGGVRAYDCEITRCARQDEPETRGLTIKITDEELLETTGGIAQGMSGSPILQDGKLVGVVTHVYIGDPQQGYAVYARWMYDQMAA
ncbi:MAG TPA: SpoIVB peptidase [Candidatus Alectryocaccomicrobium excrementavium]|uniref:SpoIVB peptidase n=1 Tax=Candidatus Alectryocaccomicrobium excrementavium TaxID=2840668 RepID=A0A9D1K5Y8_9FIRM|nr:SpoIVB peptidase [Candidatus Alectryocaccomicrobium excrementavium]